MQSKTGYFFICIEALSEQSFEVFLNLGTSALVDVQIELEFRGVNFCGGRKTGEPGEKPSEQGENQQQIQPT